MADENAQLMRFEKRFILELTMEHIMEEVDDELEDIEVNKNTKILNIIRNISGPKMDMKRGKFIQQQILCFN